VPPARQAAQLLVLSFNYDGLLINIELLEQSQNLSMSAEVLNQT